jgi:hypothetical protein
VFGFVISVYFLLAGSEVGFAGFPCLGNLDEDAGDGKRPKFVLCFDRLGRGAADQATSSSAAFARQ